MNQENINRVHCKICDRYFANNQGFVFHFNTFHSDELSLEKYCLQYEIHSRTQCIICGSMARFGSYSTGFKFTCDKQICQNAYKSLRTKEAMMEKYGVTTLLGTESHMKSTAQTKLEKYGSSTYCNPDKAKQTNLEKYGSISYTGTEEHKARVRQTCLEKYGTEHFTQNEEFKEKMKQQNLEKFGVDHPWKNAEVLKKRTDTVIEKYGGYTWASPELSEKVKKTNLERYGTEFPAQSPIVQEKTKNTNLEKYGCECTLQSEKLLTEKYGEGVRCTQDIPGIIEKQKINRSKTLHERYGVNNVSQLDWVQDIIKKNNLAKYGVEYFLSSKEVHDRIRQTNLQKYGVENPMHHPEIFQKVFESNHRKKYTHTKYTTKFGDSISYQSDLELVFVQSCEENDIRILNGDRVKYQFIGKTKYYFVDFKIFYEEKWQLIEIKAPHKWYFEDIESGKLDAKIKFAQEYSITNGYHPFLLLMSGEEFLWPTK